MNKKGLFLFPSIMAVCLSACATRIYEPKDYVLKMLYSDDFRILQLTDTHVGDKDNMKLHYDFMDLTIKDANPDLIVITGDVFTFASKGTAKEFFNWLEGHNIPWTLTWGNHDEQCFFSIDWLTGYLNGLNAKREKDGSSYCYFKDLQDDRIQGNSNFIIDLMNADNTVFEQLVVMDSNRYNYKGYFGYDYFKQDQIDWYTAAVDGTIPSLMFYHIPLPEVRNAWAAAQEDETKIAKPTIHMYEGGDASKVAGQQNEDPCNPDYNSNFFDAIKKKGSTHGMYFGHDHINNYIVNYEGIDFGYGIKATDRVYADDNLLGGRVITLKNDHSLQYDDYYHSYKEVK